MTACLTIGLLGCGGSEGQSAAPPPVAVSPPPQPVNASPVVALENADLSATVGTAFTYDATQGGTTFSDPEGNPLTYSLIITDEDFRGLIADGGIVSGTPSSFGTVNLTITATDSDGATAQDSFAVFIGTRPEMKSGNSDQSVRIGSPFNYDASQGGDTFSDADGDTLTYSIEFSPAGQGLMAEGPIISGTPAVLNPIAATITASDDDGNEAQNIFEIAILPRDSSQLFVTQEPGIINVFVKGSIETSRKYLRYQFEQFDDTAKRSRGWGWRYLDEATLLSDETFEIGARLMRGGENFFAIQETKKSDFMGGAGHGDDIADLFTLTVDETERVIDGESSYIGSTVGFRQESTLYEEGVEALNPSIDIEMNFEMDATVSRLDLRAELLRPMSIAITYMTMLSTDRYLGGDVNSLLLTSRGEWSPNFTPFDISNAGHGATRSSAERIKLSGPSGFSYDVAITEGWNDPNRVSFISESPLYNKVYFSPTGVFAPSGNGRAFPQGHVIEMKAEYRIDTAN